MSSIDFARIASNAGERRLVSGEYELSRRAMRSRSSAIEQDNDEHSLFGDGSTNEQIHYICICAYASDKDRSYLLHWHQVVCRVQRNQGDSPPNSGWDMFV